MGKSLKLDSVPPPISLQGSERVYFKLSRPFWEMSFDAFDHAFQTTVFVCNDIEYPVGIQAAQSSIQSTIAYLLVGIRLSLL
jgi:hypothetical protein